MNTAEQKGKELYDRFMTELSEVMVINNVAERRVIKMAKACALICVEEILSAVTPKPDNWSINVYWLNDRFYNQQEYLDFWNEVKQYLLTQK